MQELTLDPMLDSFYRSYQKFAKLLFLLLVINAMLMLSSTIWTQKNNLSATDYLDNIVGKQKKVCI